MTRLAVVPVLLLLWLQPVFACVGKNLTIGVVNTPQETIYAELIAQMVAERTGTTVSVVSFKDVKGLYAAVKKGDVGIIIENTDRGVKEVGLAPEGNARSTYEALKREYRKSLDLVWLEPVSLEGGNRFFAPVIGADTMGHLPALPKVINRLTSALTEESYAKLVRAVQGDEKPRKIARDFLKAKKLI
ncbi:MAG: hypothetical protein HY900_09940 [Deltaproteobacteria bacterium]|nr:hypothetical protein [Deltaproteobacteria bacterium]